jgi:hypothetical protein
LKDGRATFASGQSEITGNKNKNRSDLAAKQTFELKSVCRTRANDDYNRAAFAKIGLTPL